MKRRIITQLIKWKDNPHRKPLILNGVRQCGKTFTLKQFGNEHFSMCHCLDFEKDRELANIFTSDLNPNRILNELSFYLKKPIDRKNDLIIFDEIQACPNALTSLKYFCEEMPELALCAAGSLLGVYLNSGSYPVGKVDMLPMHPMTFTEFLAANNDEQALSVINQINLQASIPEMAHRHLWEQLLHYFIVGGLPEIVQYYVDAKNASSSNNWFSIFQNIRTKQETLIKAYFADMAKHAGKINAMHLDRIWHSVANQLAKVQDASSPKFRFKDIVPGIARYSRLSGAVDWLEKAGLIIKVHIVEKAESPLSAYTKESIFKLLMFDVGILGAMSNLSPATIINYDYGTYKGYFAENFVAQELIANGKSSLFSWHGHDSEIEFLLETDNKIIPVEVKSGNITRAKSLSAYKQKYHPEYSIILSAKNLYADQNTNTNYYPLYLAGKKI